MAVNLAAEESKHHSSSVRMDRVRTMPQTASADARMKAAHQRAMRTMPQTTPADARMKAAHQRAMARYGLSPSESPVPRDPTGLSARRKLVLGASPVS